MVSTDPSHRFQAVRSDFIDRKVVSHLTMMRVADLSAGEVVVRNRYAGVNYKDCLAIQGKAKIITGFPRVAGIESVGEVVESSSGRFRPGQEVMVHGFQTGIAFDGGFAEYLRVPAGHLMPLPAGLSPLEAAMIGVPGFTVAMALERFLQLGITPESGPVAVSGATGAVGMQALLMLSQAGYEVHALSRRAGDGSMLRALGAAQIVDARPLADETRPIERPRFAAAIDNVSGPVLSWLLRSLKDDGALASVGNASGNEFSCNVLPFILRNATVFGIVASPAWPVRERLWERLASAWRPDLSRLAPHVHMIRLENLLEHSRNHLEGRTRGRTLIRFD